MFSKLIRMVLIVGLTVVFARVAVAKECVAKSVGGLATAIEYIMTKTLDDGSIPCFVTSPHSNIVKHRIKLELQAGNEFNNSPTLLLKKVAVLAATFDHTRVHHLKIYGSSITMKPNASSTSAFIKIEKDFPFIVKFEGINFESPYGERLIQFEGDTTSAAKKAEDNKWGDVGHYINVFDKCSFKSTFTGNSPLPFIVLDDVYRPRISNGKFSIAKDIYFPLVEISGGYLPQLFGNTITGNAITTFASYTPTSTFTSGALKYNIIPPCGTPDGCKYVDWEKLFINNDADAPKPLQLQKLATNQAVFVAHKNISAIAVYTGTSSVMKLANIFCATNDSAIKNWIISSGSSDCSSANSCTVAPISPNSEYNLITCNVTKGTNTKISAQAFQVSEAITRSAQLSPLYDFIASEPKSCLTNEFCLETEICQDGACVVSDSGALTECGIGWTTPLKDDAGACNCKDGYKLGTDSKCSECADSYYLKDNACTSCPIDENKAVKDGACKCKDGFDIWPKDSDTCVKECEDNESRNSDGECFVECPENSTLEGSDCVCNGGFASYDGLNNRPCVKCGTYSSGNSGGVCKCQSGWHVSLMGNCASGGKGSACSDDDPNAVLSSDGKKCVCKTQFNYDVENGVPRCNMIPCTGDMVYNETKSACVSTGESACIEKGEEYDSESGKCVGAGSAGDCKCNFTGGEPTMAQALMPFIAFLLGTGGLFAWRKFRKL